MNCKPRTLGICASRELEASQKALQTELGRIHTSSELAAEIQQQRFVMADLEQQRFYLSEECRCLEATLVRRQLELQQADKLLHDTQADLKSVETKVRLSLHLSLSLSLSHSLSLSLALTHSLS